MVRYLQCWSDCFGCICLLGSPGWLRFSDWLHIYILLVHFPLYVAFHLSFVPLYVLHVFMESLLRSPNMYASKSFE